MNTTQTPHEHHFNTTRHHTIHEHHTNTTRIPYEHFTTPHGHHTITTRTLHDHHTTSTANSAKASFLFTLPYKWMIDWNQLVFSSTKYHVYLLTRGITRPCWRNSGVSIAARLQCGRARTAWAGKRCDWDLRANGRAATTRYDYRKLLLYSKLKYAYNAHNTTHTELCISNIFAIKIAHVHNCYL